MIREKETIIRGTDKLEWKAIFPKRDAVINNSEIIINLPEPLAGKAKTYYSTGGNFISSLVDDRTIKFDSLKSLLPFESSVIKVTFLGDFLNLEPIDYSSSKNSKSFTFFWIIIIFMGLLLAIISIIQTLSNIVYSQSKSKSRNSGNSSSDSFGGFSGGWFGGGGYDGGGGCGGGGGYDGGGGCGGGGGYDGGGGCDGGG